MDPSTSSSQNAQNKTAAEPMSRAQPPVTSSQSLSVPPPVTATPPASQPLDPGIPDIDHQSAPQSGSTNKEAGPVATAPEFTETDEEEIKPASQESKNQASQPSSEAEPQAVEVQPSIPEAKIEQSVENIIEKAPDQEKPAIPQVVKDAGVTHSGPGMINVEENTFGISTLPKTYAQAAAEEKKTKVKDSKHWLVATIMYVWRKLNPKIGKKGVTA